MLLYAILFSNETQSKYNALYIRYSKKARRTMNSNNYSSKEIGENIQKLRKARKITQEQFAKQLNKGVRTIQKYESGEIQVPTDVLAQMGDIFEMPWIQIIKPNIVFIDIKEDEIWRSKYHFDNLGDVINALFTIEAGKNFTTSISVNKPPEDENWSASFSVDGKGSSKYDADFCLFMENWMTRLASLKAGTLSPASYREWQSKTIAYYESSKLEPVSEIAEYMDNLEQVSKPDKK